MKSKKLLITIGLCLFIAGSLTACNKKADSEADKKVAKSESVKVVEKKEHSDDVVVIVKDEKHFDQLIKENKYVIADFYADWCGPCKVLAPIVHKMAEKHTDIKFIKVNVDNNRELSKRFKVVSIPLLKYFRDGKDVNKSVGVIPEPGLEQRIKELKGE